VPAAALTELLSVDREQWRQEAADIGKYLQEYGSRTPAALQAELTKLQARLSA